MIRHLPLLLALLVGCQSNIVWWEQDKKVSEAPPAKDGWEQFKKAGEAPSQRRDNPAPQAQDSGVFTALMLMRECEGRDPYDGKSVPALNASIFLRGMCHAFLHGLLSGWQAESLNNHEPITADNMTYNSCLFFRASEGNSARLETIIRAHLKEHPEDLQKNAAPVAYVALITSCNLPWNARKL
ncbi:MAG: hypothetical protein OEV94_11980 [Deltaproteobacteria bacterium]|nr:hypothetical protein [Deltaproteobacteria bacterium]